ncbi:HAMP domain-containing sensor histidine kinase [Isoptericola sp. b490]|uniref:sensor histidine kinase n=1 Tax=Actinotalea lenta TaxID=3064654 RepID=UPI002712A389|nr:HAMP domain-containing sensor histidine kinase [Isoptericola sp. b490]MDO8121945.1 HAMP domain-containing sensor histidine kinase [Isoptericola sp. b490]
MRRLLVRYGLAMTSVVLVAFLVPLGLLARSLAEQRALAEARQDAQSLAMFIGSTTDESRLRAELLAVNRDERTTTVFLPDGRVLGAPAPRTESVALAELGRALTARTSAGAEVLVPVSGPDGVAVVRTAVPQAQLTHGVAQAWLVLAVVGLVLLAGTAFAGDRIAARLSRSVRDLAGVAEKLGAGDLSARVTPSGPPEVASVGAVLNDLGDRVAGLLADERALVADLSHRLRTPITALELDVDSLADPAERERMAGHVRDLVAAVDTVIRTARQHERRTPPDCDAAAVVRDRARFWGVLAIDQSREMRVDVPPDAVPVGVDAGSLGAALDVLVDNVFQHTPPGTGFRLEVQRHGAEAVVAVSDEGPGLADATLTERGSSGVGSTGLGLDVARRTAERVGGHLEVGVPAGGRGARFVLILPEAGPAQA